MRPSGLSDYFRLLFCYVFLCFIFTSPFDFGYKKTASLKVKRFDEMYLIFVSIISSTNWNLSLQYFFAPGTFVAAGAL